MNTSHNLANPQSKRADQIGQLIAKCLKSRNKKSTSDTHKINDKQEVVLGVAAWHRKRTDFRMKHRSNWKMIVLLCASQTVYYFIHHTLSNT